MEGSNATQLENIILARLNSKYVDKPPNETDFNEDVNAFRQLLAPVLSVTDEEFDNLVRKLKLDIVRIMETGIFIEDKRFHEPWLPARRAEIDFFFWNRYKKYLEGFKHWNPRETATLGSVSDDIVNLLGDPQSTEAFQRRGLVLGDVQSGKTANYTAICNKAADTGYRVIVVLAGMLENLRRQTQGRLDNEFSGRLSQYLLDPKKKEIQNLPVGVGKYGRIDNGGKEKRIACFTSIIKDFDANILKSNNLSLHSVSDPVLIVIKKNKRILNNLISWLRINSTNNAGLINLPMLMIDDEADNASVNTKKDDEEPTAINDCINRLLKLFNQASYLGITATPFANIFINPDTNDKMRDDDLFPRDFIYSLAAPKDYIGAESIFSDDAAYKNVLEEICAVEMNAFFHTVIKKDII